MASALGLPKQAVVEALAPLEAAEIVRPTSATAAGVMLQRFHSNQLPTTPPGRALAAILELLGSPSAALRMSDGGSLSGEEAEMGLRAFAAYLNAAGLGPGRSSLAVADTAHPLAFVLTLAGLALGLRVDLGEADGADLTVGAGPGRIAFGLDGAEGETLLAWVADHTDAPPLKPVAGGRVGLHVDGRPVTLDAEALAEAALSLGATAEAQPGPLGSFGDLVGFLACLTHVGQGRGVIFRA
jgi:hypothetical protein